jgi:hypothetical protein
MKTNEQPILTKLPARKHTIQVSCAGLLPGTYICKVLANNQNFVERML